ncbi:hypothetical protein [Streptomyces sp. NK15101]|uniref:hypothetical protein n=1 Tax=Streptomyces sp. NK15101 TaxID=2873261 RepID=UPI001CED286A|nr:hypothetical protein [Streptomyces sp. NK15101]
MRHVPFFRWVLTAGFALFACSVGLYATEPDAGLPATRQIDLAVVHEKADGTCRVRWTDPYAKKTREGPYHCDVGRSDLLKAPNYGDSRGYGWASGFMFTEGPDRGDLYDVDAGSEEDLSASDTLLLLGVLLILTGLVGGNLRALPRVLGVEARLVRRAIRLAEAAGWASEDHARAVDAVRDAGRRGELGAVPDPDLVRALWVLREAGPQARAVAATARKFAARLRPLLEKAAPAAGLSHRLRAGPAARAEAEAAVAELRRLLADAERHGLRERFAQTSVDLLRGQDADRAALAAGADFEQDPEAYRRLLEDLAPLEPAARSEPSRRRRRRR